MQSNYEALRDCPEIMSKEQFRIVCHISKHTAYYLIHSGILPCEITGKKTHKYFIKRSDVLELLKKFDKNPYIVVPPKGWYKKAKRPLRIDGVRLYPPRLPTERKRKSYYTNKLRSRKDGMCLLFLKSPSIPLISPQGIAFFDILHHKALSLKDENL